MTSPRAERLEASTAPWHLVPIGARSTARLQIRPVVMLRFVTALLLIGQLGRIPVLSTGTREAPLLVNDLCLLAVLALTLLSASAARSFRVDRVAGVALVFASIGAFSAVLAVPRFGLSGMQLLISLAYLARWLVYFSVYLVVINVVRSDDAMSLWRTIEGTILAFAAFGIIQAIFLPHFAQLVYPDSRVAVDWDEQRHRLVSTMLDPNIAGAMIMLVLLVELAQLSSGERVAVWKPIVLVAALGATLSRSSFLGLFIGGAIIIAVRGVSRRMLRFAGLVALLTLPALPRILDFARDYNKFTVDASALSRVEQWLRALRVFADHPVIGVGFNTYGFVAEQYGHMMLGVATFSTDGGLLFVAVMTGVVGLTAYLVMLALVVRTCRALWRDPAAPPAWRALATGIAAGTVAVCVHSVFVNSLLTPFVMELLWLLWGLAFVMRRAAARAIPPSTAVGLVLASPRAA